MVEEVTVVLFVGCEVIVVLELVEVVDVVEFTGLTLHNISPR